MCRWDPADICQPAHLEANYRDGKQRASFPADKNTNMNCYYYYPICRLSNQPQLFSQLPSWVVNSGAKSLQICLFIYITSRANINAQFPSNGHLIMHLSSADSNVTLTLGRGISWNVMNNMIKLHSQSKKGIIRLVLWCLAAPKGPARLRLPARHHAWN